MDSTGGKLFSRDHDRPSDVIAQGVTPTTLLLPPRVFSAWHLASVFTLIS